MKNHFYLIYCFGLFLISCTSENFDSLPNRMSLSLGADEIIISSPKGYCINQETQRRHLSGVSVIISDCFAISNNKFSYRDWKHANNQIGYQPTESAEKFNL